jgi:uncharacterized protein (TIGR00255 family)
MTGFARHAAETPEGVLTCELRAVNHRYFDVQFRLPDELRPAESELRQQVGGTVKRGKIECALHFRRSPGNPAGMQLNRALVDQLARRLAEVAAALPQLRAPDPVDVLRWPGVLEDPEIDPGFLLEEAKKLLATTLGDLTAMRASEGQRIAAMLESRCGQVLGIAAALRSRMPDVLLAVRTKLTERLAKLNVDADPGRLETELALIAQKLDVDEELDRLTSHVSEVRQVVEKGGPVGRRLDFLMQELNREANTLGSKSGDVETTRAAVDLKVLIEQMREQVQNVE